MIDWEWKWGRFIIFLGGCFIGVACVRIMSLVPFGWRDYVKLGIDIVMGLILWSAGNSQVDREGY